jgi:ABC-type nitrate/sulfonate/bicarbonate transport system permease component
MSVTVKNNVEIKTLIKQKYSLLLLLVAWELLGRSALVRDVFLPPLSDVIFNLMTNYNVFLDHLLISLYRLVFGFLAGVILAVSIGILMGRFLVIEDLFSSPIAVLYPLPKIGLVPLFLLWFGIGNLSKMALITAAAFFPVVVNTYEGAKGIKKEKIWISKNLGGSRRETIRKVVFPQILPNILTGVRLATATSWSVLIIAEMIGGSEGIGFFILLSQRQFQSANVFGGIILIAILGWASQYGVRLLNKHYNRWNFVQ